MGLLLNPGSGLEATVGKSILNGFLRCLLSLWNTVQKRLKMWLAKLNGKAEPLKTAWHSGNILVREVSNKSVALML